MTGKISVPENEVEEPDSTAHGEGASPARGRGRFRRRFLFGLGLGVIVIAALLFYADIGELGGELLRFRHVLLLPVFGLALANYLLRYLKWEYFLGRLKISVPRGTSFAIFMSGLFMSITPGKIGELLKSYLLRAATGTPMARSAPIVIAERITDLIAIILLSLLGLWVFTEKLWITAIAGGAVLLVLAAIAIRPVGSRIFRGAGRLFGLGRFAGKFDELYESMHSLLRPAPLLLMTVLSILAWGCECYALYLVYRGFGIETIGVVTAFFIYAFSTLVGIVMPGGLGLTELSLVGLTRHPNAGAVASGAVAGGSAILVRIATLWFAVGIGAAVFFWFNRRLHVNLDDVGANGGEGELCRA